MTRIVAGLARGRRLRIPAGVTRPTSDRVREAVFSTLAHRIGDWSGVRVLDLFAGSGALGLEAASRGAQCVVLVERDRRAAAVARDNWQSVLPEAGVSVHAVPASTFLSGSPSGFDLVFLDPPYALPNAQLERLLELLAAGWLAPGAVIVVERATQAGSFRWPPRVRAWQVRPYSGTTVWYGLFGLAPDDQHSAAAPGSGTQG